MDTKVIIAAVVFILVIGAIVFQSSQSPKPKPPQNDQPLPTQTTQGGEQTMKFDKAEDMKLDPKVVYSATIKTSKGDITVSLDMKNTPKTVNNFIFLASKKFYDGVVFHRVIKDFMIQTGDPLGNGTGGPGYKFDDEFGGPAQFDGPGVLAMANSGPNTNGSQFFITHAATPWLNGHHTIFGKVTAGMDVVNAIATTPVDGNDRPTSPITIETIEIKPALKK